ncbi:MAG: hypothetical protein R3B09_03095 [Nannocystaceae bacterium]
MRRTLAASLAASLALSCMILLGCSAAGRAPSAGPRVVPDALLAEARDALLRGTWISTVPNDMSTATVRTEFLAPDQVVRTRKKRFVGDEREIDEGSEVGTWRLTEGGAVEYALGGITHRVTFGRVQSEHEALAWPQLLFVSSGVDRRRFWHERARLDADPSVGDRETHTTLTFDHPPAEARAGDPCGARVEVRIHIRHGGRAYERSFDRSLRCTIEDRGDLRRIAFAGLGEGSDDADDGDAWRRWVATHGGRFEGDTGVEPWFDEELGRAMTPVLLWDPTTPCTLRPPLTLSHGRAPPF